MSNIFPTYVPSEGDPSAPIWFVGEAPGYDESLHEKLRPFIGESGILFRKTCSKAGISVKMPENALKYHENDWRMKDVFITNLSHYRPRDNKFAYLNKSPQLEDGINELRDLLAKYNPNCICALGAEPLYYLCNKKGIVNYRGSILPCTLVEDRKIKVVASLHPAFIIRSRKAYPLFDFDIRRAVEESQSKRFNYPELTIDIWKDDEYSNHLYDLCDKAEELDIDIETVKNTLEIRCISFTYADYKALVFPWNDFTKIYIQNLLISSARKSFHNGVFDYTVLHLNGMEILNYHDDTLLAANVIEPELPRKLATLTSLYTRIPYYKHEGKGEKGEQDSKGWSRKVKLEPLMKYCGKDTIVTRAVRVEQIKELQQLGLYDFYRYEMKKQFVAIDLGLEGLLVDEERREILRNACKKEYSKYYNILWNLNNQKDINPGSPKQICKLLYEELNLPKRRHQKTKKITADENALISLMSHCEGEAAKLKTENSKMKWKTKIAVIKVLLQLRYWMKLYSAYVDIKLYDGKAKSIWKVAGTETGRPSAGIFLDKSGLALTTIPRGTVKVA